MRVGDGGGNMRIGIINSCLLPADQQPPAHADSQRWIDIADKPDNTEVEQHDFSAAFRIVDGNTGNAVITHALIQALPGRPEIILANFFRTLPDPESDSGAQFYSRLASTVSGYDAVFLVLQDLVRPDAYVSPEEVRRAQIALEQIPNLVVVSLGCNLIGASPTEAIDSLARRIAAEVPAHITEFVRFLVKRCSLVSVRGAVGLAVLSLIGPEADSGNVRIHGCPSLTLRSLDGLREQSPRNRLKWHPAKEDLAYVVGGLAGARDHAAVARTTVVYQEAAELSPWRTGITYPGAEALLNVLYEREQYRLFFAPEAWSDWLHALRAANECSFYLGTRLHGFIQCMTSGIPGLLTSGDVRAREFAELFCLPYAPNTGPSVEEACEASRGFDYENVLESHAELQGAFVRDLMAASGVEARVQ